MARPVPPQAVKGLGPPQRVDRGQARGAQALLPEYAPRTREWRRTALTTFLALCLLEGAAYSFVAPALITLFAAPIVLLSLLAIWALPELDRIPERSLRVLFFAYCVTLVMWPRYLAIALPGLPWITLVRLTSFPMSFMLLICVAGQERFRRELAESIRATPTILKLLTCFVLIQTLTLGLSADVSVSADKYVEAQVTWTAMYLASAYLFAQPGLIKQWAGLLWAMAVAVSVLGLWEYRLQHVPWATHIPGFLKIEDSHIANILAGVFRESGQYRIVATFSTSLGFGEYLALTLPFVLHFVITTRRWLVRIGGVASSLFMMAMAILSGTRLAAVGCFLTLLLLILLVGVQRWRLRRDSLLAPAVVLAYPAIFCAAIASAFFVGKIRRLILGDGSQQSSTDDRLAQYAMGFPKIAHNPFGYGPGMAGITLGYQPFGFLTIDTYYMAIALEYGVLGFLAYYSMFGVAIFQAGKRVLKSTDSLGDHGFLGPLALSLINFVVIKSVFSEPDNHPLVFMMLGAVTALMARTPAGLGQGQQPATSGSPTSFTRFQPFDLSGRRLSGRRAQPVRIGTS